MSPEKQLNYPPEADIQAPLEFDFGLEDFDVDAAFSGAISDTMNDEESDLTLKIKRMETILSTANSEEYREFVNFSAMAAQIEMYCNHDHALNDAMSSNSLLSGFRDSHSDEDGHKHAESAKDDNDEYELDMFGNKTKKKKKKLRRGWLSSYSK